MAIIIGTNLNDAIEGGAADDQIFGLAGNDNLGGGAGNDTIEGGAGDDLLDGELGVDTLSYASALAGVTVSLGIRTAQDTGGAGIDTLSNFENILGSAFDDVLTGAGEDNVINGGAGNDTLDGAGGLDTASYAGAASAVTLNLSLAGPQDTGGAGMDTLLNFENLLGSDFDDTLIGDIAANVIEGGAGNDTMDGGTGVDTLSYAGATAGVTVNLSIAGPQNTVVAGLDTVTNFESLTGSAFNDTLTGNAGSNTLDGGAGLDTVSYANAQAGVRVNLSSATAQNTVSAGLDTILSFENLIGSAFDDTLTGTGEKNVITGGTGNDTMDAAAGDDFLDAGDGNDSVFAGLGNDSLLGGAGNDTLYGDATSAAITAAGINRFTSFTQGTTALQMANNLLPQGAGLEIQSATFTGTFNAASSFLGINYAPTVALGQGVLLTSGDGTPALTNTAPNSGIDNKLKGDAALDAVAEDAFAGAGRTQDATILQINFSVSDPTASRVSLDLIFGSDEFPEFVDSSFVDVAAVFIDGVNYALFNGDPLQPLSIVGNNVTNGNFLTNANFPIEYDGVSSTLRVVGDLNPALTTHTLRIGIADTGDGIYDSGLFVSNFTVSRDASGIELLAHDIISGGNGNDTVDGGIGNDVLDGGAGVDTASYLTAAAGVTVNLGLATPQDTVGAGIDTLAEFENLTGSNVNDTLTGDAGANTIVGGGGDDVLDSGGGNDILDGGTGADTLAGGAGSDRYRVDNAGDVVAEDLAGGTDTVQTTITYTLGANLEHLMLLGTAAINGSGNELSNRLTGNAAANLLTGGLGNDMLNGAAGADTLAGGPGNDTYVVDNAADLVTENLAEGADTIQSSISYTLAPNVENLTLTGIGTIDGTGNELNNLMTGSAAANLLTGGLGNDVLNGGAGADLLRGGAGNDVLVFDAADVEINGGAGTDTLRMDATMTLDLDALLGAGGLIDFELLNLNGTTVAAVTVNLTAADVLQMSSTSDQLRVMGGAGDVVNAGAGWAQGADQTIGGQVYASYSQGLATLLVDLDVARNIA